jgi:molecular chaperone DnaJ
MGKPDYYKTLGLRKGASVKQIKARFRQLARRYHPDHNPGSPGSEERFKLVAEAYQVLTDQKRRSLYDRRGHRGLEEQGYRGFQRTEDVLKTYAAELFEFLGLSGLGPPRTPLRGADICYQLELSTEEAARGVRKTVQIDTMETCSQCRGNGSKQSSALQVCGWCEGSGRYSEASGVFAALGPCPKCNGKGNTRLLLCRSCDGKGRRQVQKVLEVRIPAGVESETRLKLAAHGDAGEPVGGSGDLYVQVQVRP